jgi:hypothetical protein
MAIVGEPFASYVDKQIKVRQEQMGKLSDRGPEMIAWANSKTAWVKLASGVFLSGSFAEDRLNSIGLTPPTNYMGTQLAQKNVLFGGTSEREKQSDATWALQQRSTFDQVYDTSDTDFGLVPMPGIESIDVKDKNRGSIKEASVQIKAYSRRQLEIIDTLFLRLGYTVLLEWGNSHYIANDSTYKKMGTTCAEKFTYFFANQEDKVHPKSHRDFLSAIEGLRDTYNGNYDGFLAKVTNFSWTFEPDGTYKITLKLISLGDIIESLKINLSPSKQFVYVNSSATEEENPEEPIESPTILDEILDQYKTIIQFDQNSSTLSIYPKTQTLPTEVVPTFSNGVFIYADEIKIEEDTISFGEFREGEDYENGEFNTFYPTQRIQVLSNPIISTIKNNNGSFGFSTFNSISNKFLKIGNQDDFFNDFTTSERVEGFRIIIKIPSQTVKLTNTLEEGSVFFMNYKADEDSEWGWEVDEDNTSNSNYYIRMSALINFLNRKCFPTYNKSENGVEEPIIKIKDIDNRCLTMPNQISYDPTVCLIRNKLKYPGDKEYDIFSPLAPFTGESFEKEYGDVNRIYLNFATIKSLINDNTDERGDVSIFSFLEGICNKINKALGGINNLEPILNESKNQIEIIDTSYVSENINKKQTAFQIYGYNGKIGSESESTFVRNVNLATKISPEFASMVSIGATAGGYTKGMEATAFSKWNRGMIDRFQEEYKPPKSVTSQPSSSNPDLPQDHYAEMLNLLDFQELGYKTTNEYSEISGANLYTLVVDTSKISTNLSVATEYFKYLRAKSYKDNPDEYASTANGFIPFNLQLTMDGLSGIKIYNKIEVDTRFLPFNYPQTLKFIVKRVSHKLSNGDWETSVETDVIPGAYDFSGGGGTP